ncbi:hypothetical protein [Actibacterium ureilyticum]|nr:hypothetical protein [Actibacterium ureilyticum]
MYLTSTDPKIRAAMEEARRQRSLAFLSLFRRTRPSRTDKVKGSGLATA